MLSASLRSRLRRVLVGPDESALRVGVPAVFAVAAVTAGTTAWFLASQSGGGVYWPLDAAAVGLVASAAYAARYRAAVVCLALGVAAFAGSSVGFHTVHGDETVLRVLGRFAGDLEPVTIGAVFGAIGAGAGSVLGYVVTDLRQRFA